MPMNYQTLADLLNPQEEEPMMGSMGITPQRADMPIPQPDMPELQSPMIPDNTPQEQVFSTPQLSDIIDQPQVPMPAQMDMPQALPDSPDSPASLDSPDSPALPDSTAPEAPMTRTEALLAEYNRLAGRDQEALAEARSSDRMLKVGGALGDALATYLNAQGQKNVKAPGVQVQQGAGLGKIADMFATAPEIASDAAQRRQDLLAQYKVLATGKDGEKVYQTKSGLIKIDKDGKPIELYSDPLSKRALDISEKKLTQGSQRLDLSFDAEKRRTSQFEESITQKAQEDAKKAIDSLRRTETWKSAEKTISEVKTLNTLLDDAYEKGGQSLAMIGPKVAKSIAGEVGVLTEADVTRYVKNPELVAGMMDDIKKLTTGKITEASYENIKRLLEISEKEARLKMDSAADREATLFSRREKIPYEDARYLIDEGYRKAEEEEQKKAKDSKKKTIIRRDRKSNRNVEYDADTKKPIRFLD